MINSISKHYKTTEEKGTEEKNKSKMKMIKGNSRIQENSNSNKTNSKDHNKKKLVK